MTTLYLEEINTKFNTFFTSNFTGFMFECCVMCFDSQTHHSGVLLNKENLPSNKMKSDYVIDWDLKISPILRNTHTDVNRTTDYGAMGLSILLAHDIWTEEGVWTSSQQGDGVDFWLLNPMTFKPIARLEISGIRKETANNTIGIRIKKKTVQTHQSDNSGATAYISVIEFSKPAAIFIQK